MVVEKNGVTGETSGGARSRVRQLGHTGSEEQGALSASPLSLAAAGRAWVEIGAPELVVRISGGSSSGLSISRGSSSSSRRQQAAAAAAAAAMGGRGWPPLRRQARSLRSDGLHVW